jgi:ethanolaminephosphotransferase
MLPKQVEMDGIVKRIYNAMETQSHLNSTLFVLVGDHGMNDAGNHGGSGPGETSPALLFLSPKIKTANFENTDFQAPTSPNDGGFGFYEVVEQSDIAPTLSAFLGLPIPMNNLGVVIPRLLKMFDCA